VRAIVERVGVRDTKDRTGAVLPVFRGNVAVLRCAPEELT